MNTSINRRPKLVVVFLLLCTVPPLAVAQRKQKLKMIISDIDKREIISELFEQEFNPAPDGHQLTVYLAPGVDLVWVRQIAGIKFVRLSYEDVKQADEFYEISFQVHRRYVTVDLLKGDYCNKAGHRYKFRGGMGSWYGKVSHFIESRTMETSCDDGRK